MLACHRGETSDLFVGDGQGCLSGHSAVAHDSEPGLKFRDAAGLALAGGSLPFCGCQWHKCRLTLRD